VERIRNSIFWLGRELQRDFGQESQVVITMPLLEGTDGLKKMSKSVGNYIALEDKPGEMFGKVMSISDTLMYRYYELLTTEDLGHARSLHPMEAKQTLAELVVTQYHGAEAGKQARAEFAQKFQKQEFPDEPDVRVQLTATDLRDGKTIGLVDLVEKQGWFPARVKRVGSSFKVASKSMNRNRVMPMPRSRLFRVSSIA
jgi:tyrosyl-tRNA synthetase